MKITKLDVLLIMDSHFPDNMFIEEIKVEDGKMTVKGEIPSIEGSKKVERIFTELECKDYSKSIRARVKYDGNKTIIE